MYHINSMRITLYTSVCYNYTVFCATEIYTNKIFTAVLISKLVSAA